MRFALRRPSPALVIACLALLAALAGTGVASVKIVQRSSNIGVMHVKDVFLPGVSAGGAIASCPRGARATGGGAYIEGQPSHDDHIVDSEPAVPDKINGFRPLLGGYATTWHVTYYNADANQRRLHVWVICTA